MPCGSLTHWKFVPIRMNAEANAFQFRLLRVFRLHITLYTDETSTISFKRREMGYGRIYDGHLLLYDGLETAIIGGFAFGDKIRSFYYSTSYNLNNLL